RFSSTFGARGRPRDRPAPGTLLAPRGPAAVKLPRGPQHLPGPSQEGDRWHSSDATTTTTTGTGSGHSGGCGAVPVRRAAPIRATTATVPTERGAPAGGTTTGTGTTVICADTRAAAMSAGTTRDTAPGTRAAGRLTSVAPTATGSSTRRCG